MKKVYRAIYKTEYIYANGYVVVESDNSIEGIFALDYIYIYNEKEKNTLFLKALSYYLQDEVLCCEIHLYEFYSSQNFTFTPFNTYIFFTPCDNGDGTYGITGLSLELQEEIFDEEEIKEILLSIMKVKA